MADRLPQTRDELESMGYKYTGEGRCRACGVPLLWFERWHSVNQKMTKMCFHIEAGTEDREHRILIPHWASCANAKDFRTEKKGKSSGRTKKAKGTSGSDQNATARSERSQTSWHDRD